MRNYRLLFSNLNRSGLEIEAWDMDDARFIAREKMADGVWSFVGILCDSGYIAPL
jgi:hypothetical protein